MGRKSSISRTIVVLVVVIIIIIVGAAGIVLLQAPKSTSTSSQSISASSVSSSLQSTLNLSSSTLISSSNESSGTSLPFQLVVDEPQTFDSLDPGVTAGPSGLDVASEVDLPLIALNGSNTSEFIPITATSWTSSANGLTYTFLLRTDVYYSNGDPFNAYVVWWNMYRELIINQAQSAAFFIFANASGVTAGDLNSLDNSQNVPNSTLRNIMQNPHNSITVLNSSAIQFNLAKPFVGFLEVLTLTAPFESVDPYPVEQHGGVVANQPNSWMSVNGSSFGDGPYITQQVVPNQYVIIVANPNYWARNFTNNYYLQPAHIQKITINYKADELTRDLDLETGKAQIAIVGFATVDKVLAADKNLVVPNLGPTGQIEFINLNPAKPPFNNIEVRKAIVEDINVSEIQSVAFGGFATPLVGPNPVPFAYYNKSIPPIPYNVTDAKKLLAEAGYPNGQGLPPLTLDHVSGTYADIVAQIVTSNLAQIGVTVKGQGMDQSAFFAIAFATQGNATDSPNMMENPYAYYADFSGYGLIVDDAGGLYLWFHNQTINDLVSQSNYELNSTARAIEISKITSLAQQQYAFVWLADFNDMFNPGTFVGLDVFNKCNSGGLWFSPSFSGVPYNALKFTCVPG